MSERRRGWIVALAVAVGVGVGSAVLFLSIYPAKGFDQPRGYDTARYLWRTNCVEAAGVDGLASCAPTRQQGLPGRVGYALMSLTVSGTLHVSRVTFAAIAPATLAAAMALAAAALVAGALGTGTGPFAIVAVVVAASPVLIALTTPESYAETMLALALALGGLVALSEVAASGRGWAVAAVLLGLMALVHWPTAAMVGTAVLVAAVIGLVRPPAAAPSVGSRLVIAGLAAAAVWVVGLAGLVGSGPDTFPASRAVFAAKLRSHAPRQILPVGVLAGAAGLVGLWRGPWPGGVRRWFLRTLLAAWVAVIVGSVVAWALGATLPIHRFLGAAVPLPILSAVALLWLVEGARARAPSAARWIAVAGCVAAVAVGAVLWTRSPRPVLRTERVRSAANAGAYLTAAVPPGTRVTVIADDDASPLDVLRQTFRAAIPAERIASVAFRPRAFDPQADVGTVIAARGYTRGFDGMAAEHPEGAVSADVVVLAGPPPRLRPVAGPYDTLPAGPLALVGAGMGAFALLTLVGLGWARAGLPWVAPVVAAGIAPAVALAALVAAGLAADAVGVRLTPGSATTVTVLTGAIGWAAAGLRLRAESRPMHADGVAPTIPSC